MRADLPDDLAKVLAELETRKRSLQNRLQSIETAIQSIHGLETSYDIPAEEPTVTDFVLVQEESEPRHAEFIEEAPQREPLDPAYVATAVQTTPESDRTDFILKADSPNTSLIEKEKALRRPIRQPVQDTKKAAQLNVYVNQNTDWASKQLISPKSRRAVFRHKTGQRCPKCGSQDTRLSVTKGVTDCLMFLFDYTLARCRNCDTKFRVWRSREEDDSGPEEALETHPESK